MPGGVKAGGASAASTVRRRNVTAILEIARCDLGTLPIRRASASSTGLGARRVIE
jgi:hypothetical protein